MYIHHELFSFPFRSVFPHFMEILEHSEYTVMVYKLMGDMDIILDGLNGQECSDSH